MSDKKVYRAIGLMSGTSLDGVDVALIETDGYDDVKALDFITVPYEEEARTVIRAAFGHKNPRDEEVQKAARMVTDAHIDALRRMGWQADIIGFHGQTIYHAPQQGHTVQIGDGQAIADSIGIDVVGEFRVADVLEGGEGAPLAPLYHQARAKHDNVPLPCAFLNIGGVSNVTYIDQQDILAFDTGPGNALMDDWVLERTGQPYDKDGALAKAGEVLDAVLRDWLQHPYFKQEPPKSLDRDEWDIADFGRIVRDIDDISTEDGAATLLAFTVETLKKAAEFFPKEPQAWYLCGGGRHNSALVEALSEDFPIKQVEDLGWDGDATEAECFGYLAVRSLLEEPITLPSTTGVKKPLTGGKLFQISGKISGV